jgi:predicted amidohydrolase
MEALNRAADRGARLAVTPENVVQGYPPHRTEADRERLVETAQRIDGEVMSQVRQLAVERSMDVVIGFGERDAERVHNSCAYVRADGSIAAVYRKIHCRPAESAEHQGLYVPGRAFSVVPVEVDGEPYNVGMYICFDREIPESTRCLRALGAHVVVCPLATDTSRLDQFHVEVNNEVLTQVRAAENELFIVVVNHSGPFNGGSFAVGPKGESVVQMGGDEGVALVTLNLSAIDNGFRKNPLGWAGWGYRRPDVYKHYLS